MSVTMDDVVVATSLSPRQMARQAAAMSSWRDAGFTVVSLNVGAEAEALRREPARPDLPIVTIDVDGFYGKPLPRVDDFIRYFRSLDRPYRYFGIINSDIALAEGESLREALRRETAALVFGRRTDVADFADAGGSPFENGYDYFFMSPEAVATLPESRFRIGAPWWDYWVPVVQLTAGRRAVQLPPSVVRHVRHGIAWNEAMLNEMGAHFVERLLAMPHSELLNAATAELLYKRTIRHL